MTKSTVRGELKLSPPTHNAYKAHTNRLLAAPARAFCSSFSTALQPHCYTEHKSTATHKDVSSEPNASSAKVKKGFLPLQLLSQQSRTGGSTGVWEITRRNSCSGNNVRKANACRRREDGKGNKPDSALRVGRREPHTLGGMQRVPGGCSGTPQGQGSERAERQSTRT